MIWEREFPLSHFFLRRVIAIVISCMMVANVVHTHAIHQKKL